MLDKNDIVLHADNKRYLLEILRQYQGNHYWEALRLCAQTKRKKRWYLIDKLKEILKTVS